MHEYIEEMRKNQKDILLAEAFKESQMGRSIHFSNREGKNIDASLYKKETIRAIKRLRELVESEEIKNSDIRNEIKAIHEKTGVSVGQAQKVINIYLKGYCLLFGKNEEIIKELDCPLDSKTLKGYSSKALWKIEDMGEYESIQKKFWDETKGIRLLKDKIWDEYRLKELYK